MSDIVKNLTNPLYFFNNQYNDKLIKDALGKNKRKLYKHALDLQSISEPSDFNYGTMDQFTIDPFINTKYNLPINTYTLSLKSYAVPFYSKKAYIDKYHYNIPVSLIQLMNDHNVFKYRLVFNIDIYVFLNLKIIYTEYGNSILCIYSNAADGILKSKIDTLITNKAYWSLYGRSFSDYYYITGSNITTLFGSTSEVLVSKLTNTKKMYKPDVNTQWSMYITGDASNPNLLYQTDATYGLNASSQYVFSVDSAFKTYIATNPNAVNCFVINDYHKLGSYQTTLVTDNGYIGFNMYGNSGPISADNILAYSYDNTHKIKECRYSTEGYVYQLYPDVYAIGPLSAGTYLIEYYETNNTSAIFDNNFNIFKSFMNAKFPNIYPLAIINRDLPDVLKNYSYKSNFTYDYPDYSSNELNGDLRAYNLKKLSELLSDNILRYREYTKNINNLNRKSAFFHQDMSTANSIYSRVVTDTSNNSIQDSDITTFGDDHLYIEFTNTNNDDRIVFIYVDGLRVIPTLIQTINNITCAYIPKAEVTSSSIVEAEMQFISKNYNDTKFETSFTPTDINIFYGLSNADTLGKINLSKLLFYNVASNAYIDVSKIQYKITMDQYTIQHISTGEIETVYGIDSSLYLITSDNNYFLTNDNEYVILATETTQLTIDSNNSIILNKLIDATNITFATNDSTLINAEIGVTNTDNFTEIVIPSAEIGATNTITISPFKDKYDSNQLMIYACGRLLINGEDYNVSNPTEYNGTLSIDINPQAGVDGNLELVVDYMPFDQQLICDTTIDFSSYTEGLIDLKPYVNRPFDSVYAKIYKNGERVSTNNIYETSISDVIKVDDASENDRIIIYYDNTPEMYSTVDESYDTLKWNDINYIIALNNNQNTNYTGTLYSYSNGYIANYVYNLYGSSQATYTTPILGS